MSNANSTGTSERPSNIKQFKALQEWFTFSFTPPAVKAECVVNLETLPLTFNLAIFKVTNDRFIFYDKPVT